MSRPTARESVALMAGYHSPQIDFICAARRSFQFAPRECG